MRQRRPRPVTSRSPATPPLRVRTRPPGRPALQRLLLPVAVATALALLLAAGTARADVYRWVDAQNRVHYSDVPIEGAVLIKSTVPARQYEANAANAAAAAAPAPRAATGGGDISGRLADEAALRQVQKDVEQKRSEQCKQATEHYEKSISARRIYREGKNGERAYLSESELAVARVEAKKERDEACGGGAGLK
jgi:hypothetical protein